MLKNAIARLVASLLVMVLAVGESDAESVPMPKRNPAFLQWKQRQKKLSNVPRKTTSRKLFSAVSTSQDQIDKALLKKGFVPSPIDFSYLKRINRNWSAVGGIGTILDRKYDPRPDYVTPIRHQDPQDKGIGTCWAQATIGALEMNLAYEGIKTMFSARNIVNQSGWAVHPTIEGMGWCCGYSTAAIGYLLSWKGPILEEEDPYVDSKGIVRWSVDDSPLTTPQYHVQQLRYIPGRESALDNDNIKRAVVDFGGVWVTMLLTTEAPYMDIDTGAFVVPYPGNKPCHAVTIVGWDDDYPKENFMKGKKWDSVRPQGNGAFIVRDSYGTDTRDDGYLYVSYYDTVIAYGECFAFATPESVDNYSSVYQYDPLGPMWHWGVPTGDGRCYAEGYGANIYKAAKDEEVAAVGFYANSPYTEYQIKIYVGCDDSKPTSGTTKTEYSQSGLINSYAGYYTIPLEDSVPVKKGGLFSVVVRLKCKDAVPYTFEYMDEIVTPSAEAAAGQGFISLDGKTWNDLTVLDATASFCLKAYTRSMTALPKVPAKLIISGEPSIKVGERKQFSCEVEYSDNSRSDVKPDTWRIVEGGAFASVDASGLVIANKASGDNVVRVHAEYAEGGVTVESNPDYGFYVTESVPNAPSDLVATQGDDASCVRLTWTAPKGATYYSVHRSVTSDSSNAKCIASKITDHQYSDIGQEQIGEPLIPGKDYYYFVKAGNDAAGYNKLFSNGAMGWQKLAAPEVRASDGTRLDGVEIQWGEVAGAAYYRVYRADDPEESAEKKAISGWIPQTEYLDDTAEAGMTYYYYVVAAVDNRGRRPSDYSIIEDGYRGVPVVPQSLEISGESSISSGGSVTYTCDLIYSNDTRDKNVAATWSIVSGPATAQGNKVTANVVTANGKAVLKAEYDGLKTTKEIQIAAVKPHAPSSAPIVNAEENGIRVQWNPIVDANSYSVFRKSGSLDVYMGLAIGRTEYFDDAAKPGVSYTYRISAENTAGSSADNGEYSPYSDSVCLLPSAPVGVTATTDDADKVTISWKAVVGATHYRVYRANTKTGSKTALGSWQAACTYPDSECTEGGDHYYFVRAATSSAGANVGAYSEGVIGCRPIPVTLSSIVITGGGSKVASRGKMTLSCLAKYSDGSERAVVPNWDVSPTAYAEIDANGKFTAKQVTEDQEVVVTAGYEGKTDTRKVKIIAPVVATAKISNVKAATRWPFSNLLDVDYELQTTPEGTKAAITLSGFDNDRLVAMAAHTLTGDGANGSVAAGNHRITWDVAADYPGLRTSSLDVELSAVAITVTTPTDFTASAGTSSSGVSLAWTGVDEATGYEVWRGTSSVTSGAEKIGDADRASYLDDTAIAGTTYYYWVKAVSEDGTSDFSQGVSGYRAYANVVIKFNGNEGTPSTAQLTLAPGSAYGTLPTATRTGYTFDGWYTAATGGAKITSASTVPNVASELFAHWTPISYTIVFDGNGASGTTESLPMVYGTAKNLTSQTFTIIGCFFAGWATSSTGPVVYGANESVKDLTTVNGAIITLYAKWTAMIFDVTLVVNGGTCEGLTSYTYGVGATLPIPTRANYTFGGWFTTADFTGTAVTKITATETGTKIFYAKWSSVTYTIAFNANGGGGTMSSIPMTYGESKNLPACTFTPKSSIYAFSGWATSASGAVVYADKASVSDLTTISGATVTLYAVWVRSVDLMLLKNVLTIIDASKKPDGVISESEMDLAMRNATIADMDGDIKNISDAEYSILSRIKAVLCDNATLSQNLIDVKYDLVSDTILQELVSIQDAIKAVRPRSISLGFTVAFDRNDGSGVVGTVSSGYSYPATGKVTVELYVNITRVNYALKGWSRSPSGGVEFQLKSTYVIDITNLNVQPGGSVTLYAVWEPLTYQVVLNKNGGVCSDMTSYTFGVGAMLPTPTKENYIFGGWFTTSDCTGSAVQQILSTDTGEKTFYAKWVWGLPLPETTVFDGAAPSFSVLNGPDGVLVKIENTIPEEWWSTNSCNVREFAIYESATSDLSAASLLATLEVTNSTGTVCYTNALTTVGEKHWYWVLGCRANKGTGIISLNPLRMGTVIRNRTYTKFSNGVSGYRRLPDPSAPTVVLSGNQVKISWAQVNGASEYVVYKIVGPPADSGSYLSRIYWDMTHPGGLGAQIGFTSDASVASDVYKSTTALYVNDEVGENIYYAVRAVRNGMYSNRSSYKKAQ